MKENTIQRKSSFESSVFSLGSAGHPLLLPGSYFLVSLFFFSGVCWKKQNIRNKIFGRKRYCVLSNIIIIVIKINRIFLWPKDWILQQGKWCGNWPCYLLRAAILFFVFLLLKGEQYSAKSLIGHKKHFSIVWSWLNSLLC